MTGSETPLPTAEALADSLLDQILRDSHPLLAEGLTMAALPQSYDAALLGALRARDDGRDERLTERIAQFSFVERLAGEPPRFRVSPGERDALQRRWIAQDGDAYRAAHRRAFDHLSATPLADPFSQDQALLFHQLFFDGEAAMARYAATARFYLLNHQLAALERLIASAREAQPYLAALDAAPPTLHGLSDYLGVRLMQQRGHWAESLPPLNGFLANPTFPKALVPFVQRAVGLAYARQGRYMDAVEVHRKAIKGFAEPGDRGDTMVHIGDAYRDLAIAARGHNLVPPPPLSRSRRLRLFFALLPSLPVLIFLALQGFNLRSVSTWQAQGEQDWLLARLYGMAARWYRRADETLDPLPQTGEALLPDERLAELTLTIGDAAGAAERYRALAERPRSDLSDYRRARAWLGLAKALLRQGDYDGASGVLARAQPLLEQYQDEASLAESHLLHGEIGLRAPGVTGEASVGHFERALAHYRAWDDRVAMTEIAERLEEAAAEPENEAVRAALAALAASVTERSYRVRFRHSLALLFQRLSLAFVAIVLFLLPMVTLGPQPLSLLDLNARIEPDAASGQNPLMLRVEPTLGPSAPTPPPLGPALDIALLMLGGYLGAQLLLGLMLILFTQSRQIEKEVQREQIHLDREGVRAGDEGPLLPWGEITESVSADMRLGRGLLADNSGLMVRGASGAEVWVPGYTARYEGLSRRLSGAWPKRDVGYSLLRSKMGMSYLLGLALLLLSILLSRLAPGFMNRTLVANYSPYQIVPFFFLLLMVPTLWWAALRPLRLYYELGRLAPLVWWVAGGGIALALLRFVLPGRLLLVFPSLVAFGLLAAATLALWRTRRDPEGPPPSWRSFLAQPHPLRVPRALRLGMIVLMAALLVPLAVLLARDLAAHHTWVQAQAALARAVESGATEASLGESEALYGRALGFDPYHPFALQGLAAVQTHQGRYEEAEATFGRALAQAPNRRALAYVLADRGAMYARWGLATTPEDEGLFNQALADVRAAYRIHDHPPLRDKVGQIELFRGWLLYRDGDFDGALRRFNRATDQGANPGDAALARGYAFYQLGQFASAHKSWTTAIERRSENNFTRTARAMATWQIARGEEPGLCEDGTGQPETIARLEAGLADLRAANQIQEAAFTYRTIAQFHYLLRRCPGYDLVAQFEAAIEGYRRATELEPLEPFYWEMLGRLRYALSGQEGLPAERVATLQREARAAIAEAARVAALPVPEGEGRIGTSEQFPQWQERLAPP